MHSESNLAISAYGAELVDRFIGCLVRCFLGEWVVWLVIVVVGLVMCGVVGGSVWWRFGLSVGRWVG